MTDQHPTDAITEADAEQEARDHVFDQHPSDVLDFNPERCPHTWTPTGRSHPVRCTRRIDDHGDLGPDDHAWSSFEQDLWIEQARRVLADHIAPRPTAGTRAPILVTVDGHGPATYRQEITDAQVDAAVEAWMDFPDRREHITVMMRAALEAASRA